MNVLVVMGHCIVANTVHSYLNRSDSHSTAMGSKVSMGRGSSEKTKMERLKIKFSKDVHGPSEFGRTLHTHTHTAPGP